MSNRDPSSGASRSRSPEYPAVLWISAVFSTIALIVAAVALGLAIRPSHDPVAGASATTVPPPSPTCPASAGLGIVVADHGAAPATGRSATIQAGDSFFAPTCTSNVAAGTITLTVHNSGQLLHNFSVPGQGIDEDVDPGRTITVQVTVGAGVVHYFCKIHRTSGMVGALLPAGRS